MNEQQENKTLRMLLKKFWIEDFHAFCKQVGGDTFHYMDKLLKFEADCMTMQFIYNGMMVDGVQDKQSFIPSIGYL